MSETTGSKRITARARNLISCLSCGQLARMPEGRSHVRLKCPTCGAKIESREPNTIATTWALVITGFVLYIPANLFPIMNFSMLGDGQPDTILTGVTELFQSGMWAIGLLVFCASIAVPLLKLIGLAYLLITTQRANRDKRRQRSKLFRTIELIGRWSMLDVFLLSILVAVVNLGQLASVTPEVGMVFFATVVIVTMIAAEKFDARAIWDQADRGKQ